MSDQNELTLEDSDDHRLTVADYVAIARRRWLYLLVPLIVITAGAVLVALWLPPIFRSTGTILVESQQIPRELVQSTVTSYADERIQIIQQLVMTRENILRIISKFDLLAEDREKLTMAEQVEEVRSNISIEQIVGGIASSRYRTTTAFTLSYEDHSPERAYAVANELVTLFLEENVRTRTERASETTGFLSQEADKLQRQLETIESEIAAYKQEYSQSLPEHLDLHMGMLHRTEAAIEAVDRDIKSARDRYRLLEIELSAIRAGQRAGQSGQMDSTVARTPEQELLIAQAELTRLESRYSQKHPDVRNQKRQIAELEAELSSNSTERSGEQPSAFKSFDVARVHSGMDSERDRIKSLEKQRQKLEGERQELERIIIETPQVERALIGLNRDHANVLQKFNEIQSKEMEARLAESLEEEKKAERFSLLEPPIKPERPIKPDRKKIIGIGFFLALASGFGLVILLEIFDKRVYGEEDLTRVLGERPLAVIPFMEVQEQATAQSRAKVRCLSAGVTALFLAAAVIHFSLAPLDLVVSKILSILG